MSNSAKPKRWPALFEALEPRTLLSDTSSAMLADGFALMKWHGQSVYAKPGEWLLQVDGLSGSPRKQVRAITRLLDHAHSQADVQQYLGVDGQVLIKSRGSGSYRSLLKSLKGVGGFAGLEPNLAIQAASTFPNDTNFNYQYFLNNTGQTGGTPDADMDAPEAWDITRGDPSVVIGIIDTGVNYNHPDLAANVWTNPGEIPNDGIDNDGNGFIDDIHGWDFANNDSDPMDDNGHGTRVAGIADAVGDNGAGVSGVAWNARIMPLKFLSADGTGETSAAVQAIHYAIMMRQRGVNIGVVNNSWGDGSASVLLQQAIADGGAAGILFVAAAGNNQRNTDTQPFFPASYALPNIISVAGTDSKDALWSGSNFGAVTVDVGAPADSVYTTALSITYGFASGTSMAAPQVTGLAALALSISPPGTSYQIIRDAILNGGDPIAALAGKTVTGKRINALGTLMQLPMLVLSTQPAAGTVLNAPPTDFVVNFSHPFAAGSLAASDLTVNGITADAVSVIDSRTVSFHFNTTPVTNQGQQTISLAAASVLRGADAAGVQSFSDTFRYDAQFMQVILTQPAGGSIVPPPLTALDVQLSEAVDPASVGVDDLVLSHGTVASALMLDDHTIRYTLAGLNTETRLDWSLPAGALADLFGNPGQAYSATLQLDVATAAYPTPLSPTLPLGSLVYAPPINGLINFAGDTDSFTLSLEAGQTLAIIAHGDTGLRPTIEVRGPSAALLGSAVSTLTSDALLQKIAVSAPGTYTITVGSAGGTVGSYTLTAVLNAAVEAETYGGASNDDIASAQNIDNAMIPLPGGGERAAVLGRTDLPSGILLNEVEPNDAKNNANSADLNFVPSGNNLYHLGLSGDISSSTDSDYFNIGLLDIGDILTISLAGDSGSRGTLLDPFLELYRGSPANPIRVIDDDDGGTGSDPLIYRLSITAADTYFVRTRGFDTNQTGSYDLALYLENAGAPPLAGGTVTNETEPNDSVVQANDVTNSWRAVQYVSATSGKINVSDHDLAAYSFNAGDLVTIVVHSTSSLDARVTLRNSAGISVAQEDGNSIGPGADSPIYGYIVPSSGTYYVDTAGQTGTGTYITSVYLSTDTPPAVPLPVADFYAVSLKAGQYANIGLAALQAGDIQLELQDSAGTILASGSTALANLNQTIMDFVGSQDATYYLRVLGDRDLDYNLVVTRDAEFDAEPNNNFASAQDISATGRVLGYTSDDDWYQFPANPGDQLKLQTWTPGDVAGEFTNALDPVIELYDPNGALVASDDNSAADGRNALLNYTATMPGNYRVHIRGNASHGEYVLSYTSIPSAIHGTPGDDIFYLRLDAAQQNVQVFNINPPVGQPLYTIPKGVFSTVPIDGGDGNDQLIIDNANGNVIQPGGLSFDGGAGDDAITILNGAGAGSPGTLKLNVGDGANTFMAKGGTTNLDASFGIGGVNLIVAVQNDAVVDLTASQQLAGLNINDNARVNLLAGPDGFLSLASLFIGPAGTLDLGQGDLILQADDASRQDVLTNIAALIASARNGLTLWQGSGITSSQAANNSRTGLAVALNDDGQGGTLYAAFDGQSVDQNTILVKYTWNGDMDLSGQVDSDDYFRIDAGFVARLAGYRNGDLDFSGIVDADDYFLIDAAFTSQTGKL
jgi:subtilisin family serine protease